MNKRSNLTITWAGALMFAMCASISLGAKPRLQAKVTTPTSPQQKATARSYACPMHPEVKSTRKGKCPKCKMDLRLVSEDVVAANRESHVATAAVGEIVTAAGNTSASAGVPDSNKKLMIPDVEVLDQEGNALHFYRDLIKGKIVAINFIFTNCTTICPPLAATFARLQKEMGDKVGKDVHLISISVDPLTDTPERLKAWGAKFKAGPGWTFVTGEKQQMDELLNAFGAAVSRREDHTPALIIGNDAREVWTRTYGLAKINQIMSVIDNVSAGRVETVTSKETKP